MPLIVIADAVMDVFIRFALWLPRADWIMPDVLVAVDVVMLTVPLWVMLPAAVTFSVVAALPAFLLLAQIAPWGEREARGAFDPQRDAT